MEMKKLLIIGLIVGIVLISGCITEEQESQKEESISEDCFIKIPKTIKLLALEAYPSSVVDSDYIEVHLPKNLCILSYPPEIEGYYVVQFRGPIYEEYKDQIRLLGAIVHDYIPENAFIVKMNESTREEVQNLEIVRWIGLYQPAYKMQPSLINSLNRTGDMPLTVLIFSGENMTDIANKIDSPSGATATTSKIRILIDASKIPDIANIIGVQFIEEYRIPQLSTS